jgi:hypothetical protein
MIVLAPKYYLHYFEFLLRFVFKQYKNLLHEHEKAWFYSFFDLPEDSRCLWLRMYNRKGQFFKFADLQYEEITNTTAALQKLCEAGFAKYYANFSFEANLLEKQNNEKNEKTYLAILDILTKIDLIAICKILRTEINLSEGSLKKLKKDEISKLIFFSITYHNFIQIIDNQKIIEQCCEQEANFFRFLFFGNAYQDMTEFVMRDIEKRRFEDFDETKFTPQFKTRQELDEKFGIAEAYHVFLEMKDNEVAASKIFAHFAQYFAQNPLQTETAKNSYNRFVLRVAEWLEKNKLLAEALQIYEYATLPPARQKQVRILQKLSRFAEALQLCEQMLGNAQNAEEHIFATDFVAKVAAKTNTKKVNRSVTAYLKEAESIAVDKKYKAQVELGVVETLKEQGYLGVFTENYVWRALFALVFWDIILDSHIHNPLQSRPSDFYAPSFFESRKELIDNRLALITSKKTLQAEVEKTYKQKFGIQNSIIEWHEAMLPLVYMVCELVPLSALKAVWLEMFRNTKEGFKGFPDIIVWNQDSYCFIEVKSPTDNLSAQQLYWLHFFARVGIKAKVLRVEFV